MWPEWILRLCSALLGRTSAAQGRRDRANERKSDCLFKEASAIRESYRQLMADYIKMSTEMRQDYNQQFEVLRDEISGLKAALERERNEHAECRRKLVKHEAELATLKGQVKVLMQQERTRQQGGDDAGS